jgi:general secretion pathway protein J
MSRASRTERASRRTSWRTSQAFQAGFTLLEILVALVIFASASMIAYSGLNAVISVKGSLDREIRFWRQLGQVFERIEMDFVQILPHLFSTGNGEIYPPLLGSAQNDSAFSVELSRYDEDRTPLRASYRCGDGLLTLSLQAINSRLAVSPSPAAPPHTLLQNVESCDLAFLGADNSWLSSWPGNVSGSASGSASAGETAIKPRAIRLRLTLAGRGQFERLYYLP